MSLKYYCVLWIPTIFHDYPTPIINEDFPENVKVTKLKQTINIDNVEISDGKGNLTYLDLTLEKTNSKVNPAIRSIWIGARTIKRTSNPLKQVLWIGSREKKDPNYIGNYKCELKLTCVDVRRNGLAQFSYQVPLDIIEKKEKGKHLLLNKEGNITHATYHAIKSFYHNHKFHEHSDDSIVNPLCNKKDEIDLEADNNLALEFYLSQYEKKLLKLVRDIDNKVNRLFELYESKTGKGRVVILSKILLDECSQILGFHVYYCSLYYSKHNTAFRVGGIKHQQAINIENSIRYINVVKAQFRNFCNLSLASLTLENQELFKDIQQNIKDSVISIESIQSDINSAVTNIESIQKQSESNAVKWNRWSRNATYLGIIVGVISLFSGLFSVYQALTSPDKQFIETNIKKQDKYIDSLVNTKNKALLDSIKFLLPKTSIEAPLKKTKKN